MGARDRIRRTTARYLEDGEQVHAVFSAQRLSGWWAAPGGAIGATIGATSGLARAVVITGSVLYLGALLALARYRAIVVTDRRILVCDTGKISTTKAKSLLRVLPRALPIGPVDGLWWRTDQLGERLYVHWRFHKDVAMADARRPWPHPTAPAI